MSAFALRQPLADKSQRFIRDMLHRTHGQVDIEFSDGMITTDFNGDAKSTAEVAALLRKLIFVAKNINEDRLYEHRVERSYGENPQSHLEACGDVKKVASGMFMLQGTFWKIFCALHEKIKQLAASYGAIEQEYPALWPVDLYKKINYFSEFPQQVLLAAGTRQDFASRTKFAKTYTKSGEYQSVAMDDHFANAQFGLQSAVCDCCYYALENTSDFPDTVFTCYNKVFRNETSEVDSLDRLTNFSVRDIMFVGSELFVLKMRQHMIEETTALLRDLDLDARIETANDPFFGNDAALKTAFQYASQLKHELLARLPYADSHLAVGSINLHTDFFGKAFNIRLADGSPAFSGCMGIGFERLVYALYCQYGHDVTSWPDSLLKYLGIATQQEVTPCQP